MRWETTGAEDALTRYGDAATYEERLMAEQEANAMTTPPDPPAQRPEDGARAVLAGIREELLARLAEAPVYARGLRHMVLSDDAHAYLVATLLRAPAALAEALRGLLHEPQHDDTLRGPDGEPYDCLRGRPDLRRCPHTSHWKPCDCECCLRIRAALTATPAPDRARCGAEIPATRGWVCQRAPGHDGEHGDALTAAKRPAPDRADGPREGGAREEVNNEPRGDTNHA